MKLRSFCSLVLLSFAFGATGAVIAEEAMEDRCRTYAVEDNIPAEEVELYVEECIEILGKENTEQTEGKTENEKEKEKEKESESEKKD